MSGQFPKSQSKKDDAPLPSAGSPTEQFSQDIVTMRPVSSIFLFRVIGIYYLFFSATDFVLNLTLPVAPSLEYASFQIAVAQGRFIPGSCALVAFVLCVRQGPSRSEILLAKMCAMWATFIFFAKCLWLAFHLPTFGEQYIPQAAWTLIEIVTYTYIGVLTINTTKQAAMTKKDWMTIDLVILFATFSLFVIGFLRAYSISIPHAISAGLVVGAIVSGYKFAKFTYDFLEESATPNQTPN